MVPPVKVVAVVGSGGVRGVLDHVVVLLGGLDHVNVQRGGLVYVRSRESLATYRYRGPALGALGGVGRLALDHRLGEPWYLPGDGWSSTEGVKRMKIMPGMGVLH